MHSIPFVCAQDGIGEREGEVSPPLAVISLRKCSVGWEWNAMLDSVLSWVHIGFVINPFRRL